MLPAIAEISENFALLDEWEDRYRYVIELGRMLEPMPDADRIDANKVMGCASQVWLTSRAEPTPDGSLLHFQGDSDAHIVRGLVAILIANYSGRSAREIAEGDALALFRAFGLEGHLSAQRSNGLRSMVERIRTIARAAA